jgi:FMN phosphatase YigB (HAD superfamily)
MEMNAQKPLIVFDVNETLVDLENVTPVFERIFGEKNAMRLWFANLILYSQSLTQAGLFERHFSAGDVQTHKPNAKAYQHVETELAFRRRDFC